MSFITLNNKLVDRITKAKSPKAQKNILNKIYNAYKNKMMKNSTNYFKNNKQAKLDFDKYTLNSIYERVLSHIETTHNVGTEKKKVQKLTTKDASKHLKKVLNNLVRGSRAYQKQKTANIKKANSFNKYDKDQLFDYIITHPIRTEHSDECARDLLGSPYTRDKAIKIQKSKPNHNRCTCHLIPRKTSNILIQQDNF